MSLIDDIAERQEDLAMQREGIKIDGFKGVRYNQRSFRRYDGMTMKQKIAADTFLETGSVETAKHKAGYEGSASTNMVLKLPPVHQYISNQISASAERTGITIDWKMGMLKLIAVRCVSEDLDSEIKASLAQAAISAISELNKMQGHYAPNVNINQNLSEHVDRVRLEIKQHVKVYDEQGIDVSDILEDKS